MSEAPSMEAVVPLLVLLAAGIWIGWALQRFAWRVGLIGRRRRNTSYERHYPPQRETAQIEPSRPQDAVEQLRVVMNAEFSARALLNQSEARVFEEALPDREPMQAWLACDGASVTGRNSQ